MGGDDPLLGVWKTRESKLMQLQYGTAVVALVLVALHLLMQGVLVPYSTAISFQHVLSVYRSWIDGSLLEVLLVVVVAHGFNGFRIILVEWKQGKSWTTMANWGTMLAALLAIVYGTRTVILAVLGTGG
ncbi:MAG TPA: succinate dehydrogenase [Nitrososphaerales archaeon]|nr:succinate dehydrogenase [Nitrososphaerales archaeon]